MIYRCLRAKSVFNSYVPDCLYCCKIVGTFITWFLLMFIITFHHLFCVFIDGWSQMVTELNATQIQITSRLYIDAE